MALKKCELIVPLSLAPLITSKYQIWFESMQYLDT